MLLRFAYALRIVDLVVIPDTDDSELIVGRLPGDYGYLDQPPIAVAIITSAVSRGPDGWPGRGRRYKFGVRWVHRWRSSRREHSKRCSSVSPRRSRGR
jgi:hypothetical protein